MRTKVIPINSNWRFQELPATDVPAHCRLPWLPARVPGHVHLDLVREGVIPHPFQRMHEHDVAWVDERDWIYETTFQLEAQPANPRLIFHGLDTVAEIQLNGSEIGRSDNMFIPHEFAVDAVLKAGQGEAGSNTLRVILRSAKRIGIQRQDVWNAGPDAIAPHWDNWSARSMVRKAQYMFGWDWGPVLISAGIWRGVDLVSVPAARLLDWSYDVSQVDPDRAIVTVSAEVERVARAEHDPVVFNAYIGASEALTPAIANVPCCKGRHHVSVQIAIASPRLWQPHGSGCEDTAALYDLQLSLTGERQTPIDSRTARIGLRKIELVHEPDPDGKGEGFKFRVNGVDLFAKGANWIPNDSFPGAITKESLRERLTQARDAGLNMLRVWGGGLYESEDFYSLCDELGLMVWQDFPYACAYYPDTGEHAEVARVEATAAVRRLRNHPSLALWCGNNENLMMFQSRWDGLIAPRYLGELLYNDILPAVVRAENPGASYWPTSPFGGKNANSADFGDCHNWDVWHGRGDWMHYDENDCRFCSEFGFAASCGLPAWATVLSETDRDLRSPVVAWHDKTRKGYETYLGYIGLHFPESRSLEDLVYYSQINQAEALKYGVEHYRRRKGRCWGTLFWQFNDCWPTQSWAIVDYLGDPKAAYYAAKRFYAPLLLSLVRAGGGVSAHLVNDLSDDLSGMLTFTLKSFEGEELARLRRDVSIGANSAAPVAEFNLTKVAGRELNTYVLAEFQSRSGPSSNNILLLAEPKMLELSEPGLALSVDEGVGGKLAITVSARRFAPYVWLRRSDDAPLAVDDNFFHLQPGESRSVSTAAPNRMTAAELEKLLVVRTLVEKTV
jgi:beta-mannosidase